MVQLALVALVILNAIHGMPFTRREFHLDALIDVNESAEAPILRKRQDGGMQMESGSMMQDGGSMLGGSGSGSVYESPYGGDTSTYGNNGDLSTYTNNGDPYILQDPYTQQPSSNQLPTNENLFGLEPNSSSPSIDEIQQTTTTTTTTVEEEQLANQQQNPSDVNINISNVTVDNSHDNTSLLNNTNSGVQNNGGDNGGDFSASSKGASVPTQSSNFQSK